MVGPLKVVLGVAEVFLFRKAIWNVPTIIGILGLHQGC
jgi:hypothetical protein